MTAGGLKIPMRIFPRERRGGTCKKARNQTGYYTGRKSKALTEKIDSGLTATVIELPEPSEISGEYVPPVKDFLKAAQKSGIDLCAEDVFKATFLWLKEKGCGRLVNTQLIEQYAMIVSRWVQCETFISEYGLLAKLKTAGIMTADADDNVGTKSEVRGGGEICRSFYVV